MRNIIREICVYERQGNAFVYAFEIRLNADQLAVIFAVDKEDDPEVYKIYFVTAEIYSELKKADSSLKEIDFNTYALAYECSED
jgi:hypothetical protein